MKAKSPLLVAVVAIIILVLLGPIIGNSTSNIIKNIEAIVPLWLAGTLIGYAIPKENQEENQGKIGWVGWFMIIIVLICALVGILATFGVLGPELQNSVLHNRLKVK